MLPDINQIISVGSVSMKKNDELPGFAGLWRKSRPGNGGLFHSFEFPCCMQVIE